MKLIKEAKRWQKLAGILTEADETTPEESTTPETPAGTISKEQAKQLIKNTNGKFFTATFIKKDGTTRVMNARLGVKAYLKGGELPYDPESKGLIPVYSLDSKGYRMINMLLFNFFIYGIRNSMVLMAIFTM